MARIYIEPEKARRATWDEQTLATKLTKLSGEVDSVNRSLRYKIAGQEQISEQLRLVVEQIARESASTKNLRDALDQIVNQYTVTENGNRDREVADETAVQQVTGAAIGNAADPYEFKWGDLLCKELGSLVGPFGFLFTGVPKLGGEYGDATYWNEVAKGLGKVISTTGDTNAEWFQKLFGLNKYTPKSFWENLGDFSSVPKAAGTVCKWGTSLVSSMIGNLKEEGLENWSGRFWKETVNEAGIKIVEGAGIATLVGLAVAAAPVSVPAVAVGAATVAVTAAVDYGINSIVRYVSGNPEADWVEMLSDATIDFGEKVVKDVGQAVQNTVNTVKETGKKVADTVSNGFNAVKSGISNLFSGCGWGKVCYNGAW